MTDPEPALYGVLVTYRRPDHLSVTLDAIVSQTVSLRRLVVVDNDPTAENEATVRQAVPNAHYVAAPENLGPAGGLALGMGCVLTAARDDDWIASLDDDDPPKARDAFATLLAFAGEMRAVDASTAAVGRSGVRFDERRGRIVRVPDSELVGGVSVDSISGNQCPLYSAGAVRVVGPHRPELFFGFEELELGLRLRDAGYTLYAHGPIWLAGRRAGGRLGASLTPSRGLDPVTWRRYYSLRNLIWILRERGAPAAALRVTVLAGFAKPIANLAREPGLALQHLRLNAQACRDAWTRRMGRTVEPSA